MDNSQAAGLELEQEELRNLPVILRIVEDKLQIVLRMIFIGSVRLHQVELCARGTLDDGNKKLNFYIYKDADPDKKGLFLSGGSPWEPGRILNFYMGGITFDEFKKLRGRMKMVVNAGGWFAQMTKLTYTDYQGKRLKKGGAGNAKGDRSIGEIDGRDR